MRLLFKYPTRGRVERFFDGLESIISNLYDNVNFEIRVTADVDDPIMANDEVISKVKSYPNTKIHFGISNSKVDAVNRDLELFDNWDVIIVMSDDMKFTFYGFDQIIRQQFEDNNFDKYIHIPDNDAKTALATMYIAGKDFVNRFGYLYNPIYSSLFCDNDIQETSKILGCYRYVDFPGLIFHANAAYGHMAKDEMFIKQQEIGWTKDQETYNERKKINFGL